MTVTRDRVVRWGKLYVDLPTRKATYSDAQFRAYVTLLCIALGQDSGRFRDRRQVEALIGKRVTDHLFREEDLIEEDGGVTMVGFDRYQGPRDATNAERQRRYREREAEADVTRYRNAPSLSLSVTSDSSPTNGKERGSGGEELSTILTEVEALTGRPWAYRPGSTAFDTLQFDVRDFGAAKVRAALRRVDSAGKVYDAAALVMAAHRIVQPIPDVRAIAQEASREAAQDAASRRSAAGVQRTQEYLANLRRAGQSSDLPANREDG